MSDLTHLRQHLMNSQAQFTNSLEARGISRGGTSFGCGSALSAGMRMQQAQLAAQRAAMSSPYWPSPMAYEYTARYPVKTVSNKAIGKFGVSLILILIFGFIGWTLV